MGGQYFEKRPASARRPARITVTIRGRPFLFQTDSGVFSREGLDRGTELLLEAIEVGPCESILDLGCGYGVIGIVAAHLSEGGHVILTDVNERAAALARANIAANGIRNAEVRIGDAPSHLLDGGSLWLVARTRQGADTIRLRMRKAFDNADVVKRGSGYKVLRSVKSGA